MLTTKNYSSFSAPSGSEEIKAVNEDALKKQESKEILREILSSTVIFGIRGLTVAAHYVGNGLMMSSLGSTQAAASSVTTTLQTFTIGAASGFLTITGVHLANALDNDEAIRAAAKMGIRMSFLLGATSAIVFLTTPYTLPLVIDSAIAESAADFSKMFALAAIPDLLTLTNGQIIFQIEKNKIIPFLSTAIYRGGALGLSYYLGIEKGYGPWGIGLGAGLAGWTSVLLFQPWFLRKAYKKLNLFNPSIQDFFTHLRLFMKDGWPLSLQRITEWVNLLLITQIVGNWSKEGLLAEQSSVVMLTLCNIVSQGAGQASMMIAARNCTNMKKYFTQFENEGDEHALIQAKKMMHKNQLNYYISTTTGLVLNAILAGSLFYQRDTIVHWYLPEETPEEILKLSETLFWINMLSLIPDAMRIISGSVLRGWGDLITPTLISLLMMTIIGIPAGAGIGLALADNIIPLFVARIVGLAASALYNLCRISTHGQADQREYESLIFFRELVDAFSADSLSLTISPDSTFLTTLNSLGFSTKESKAEEKKSFFACMTNELGVGNTENGIKRAITRHIKNNLDLYQDYLSRYMTQDDFFDALKNKESWTNYFLAICAARTFNINLVVITQDQEPVIIFRVGASQTIYLGCNIQGEFCLLRGTPSESLKAKMREVQVGGLDQTLFRENYNKSHAISYFFVNKPKKLLVHQNNFVRESPLLNQP